MVLEIFYPDTKLEQLIDLKGNTLMHIAASAGNNNLLRNLKAETNIDPDFRNKKGMTALEICLNDENEQGNLILTNQETEIISDNSMPILLPIEKDELMEEMKRWDLTNIKTNEESIEIEKNIV